jgi:hypothetical protein
MDNTFEKIKGFENYSINRDGMVLNRCGREMKPCITRDGYTKYTLYENDGKTRHKCSLHRLIALQFIPNPENKQTVDHIDRNKQNNDLSNLRWATVKEQANNRTTTIVLAEGQTKNEYKCDKVNANRLKNNEIFKAKDKAYYEENKEQIQAKRKQKFMENEEENKAAASARASANYFKRRDELLAKIDCECGGKYCLHSKARHFQSERHKLYLSK